MGRGTPWCWRGASTSGEIKMTININELRRLAQAATPGPWGVEDVGHKYIVSKSGDGYISREVCKLDGSTMSAFRQKENGPFIAAANPTTIEALLDHIEAVKKERDALRLEIHVVQHERDHANQRYSSALRILTGIHAVLYPPRFTDHDGRTWRFESPSVEQLWGLSDRIRVLLDEIAHAAPEEAK